MNSFGNLFRLTTFGESHGPAIGGIIDGMPAGVDIDVDMVQRCLDSRRPAATVRDSQRREADRVEILSGVYGGRTLGTPVGFIIRNNDARSADYERMRDVYRPGHADYTYQAKYGLRDYRGGGRASARETACRVVGGAFAMQALYMKGITVDARVGSIGTVNVVSDVDLSRALEVVDEARADGDTLGGTVLCTVNGVQAGLGEPVYGKLHAMLAAAMMSIPAAKGFEYGMGFEGTRHRGSEVVDPFVPDGKGGITTSANFSGGIQGGISNGCEINMRVAFKPVPTLMRPVATVDSGGHPVILEATGRHDSCVVMRAVPVVRAMAAMTVLDALLVGRAAVL